MLISIHALVKRATYFHEHFVVEKRYFNPRPREEGDRVPTNDDEVIGISIHALVKRATYIKILSTKK